MSRAHRLPVTALFLAAAMPLAWIACGGGESKPPETAASEDNSDGGSSAPAEKADKSDKETPPAASSAAEDTPPPAASTAEAPAAAAPPPATFGSTDCGACVDKACAKPEATCGKNSDCQTMLDSIHSCTSGGSSCIENASAPSAPKPKKLAGAVTTCAKKAMAGKTCKAKCQ
jgi:hypothetical protein